MRIRKERLVQHRNCLDLLYLLGVATLSYSADQQVFVVERSTDVRVCDLVF